MTTMPPTINTATIENAVRFLTKLDFQSILTEIQELVSNEKVGSNFEEAVNEMGMPLEFFSGFRNAIGEMGIWSTYLSDEMKMAKKKIEIVKKWKVLNRWAEYILKNDKNIISIQKAFTENHRYNNSPLLGELLAQIDLFLDEWEQISGNEQSKYTHRDKAIAYNYKVAAKTAPTLTRKQKRDIGGKNYEVAFDTLFDTKKSKVYRAATKKELIKAIKLLVDDPKAKKLAEDALNLM
jgi:hypothetical protein